MNVRKCKIRDILDQIDRDVNFFSPDEIKIAMSRSKTVVRRLIRNRSMNIDLYDQIKEDLHSRYMSDSNLSNKQAKFDVLERVMERKRRKTYGNRKHVSTSPNSIASAVDSFFRINY